MTKSAQVVLVVAMFSVGVAACGRGVQVLETTPKQSMGTGTVTGIVTGPDGKAPLIGRVVEAVRTDSSERVSARTNEAGGYTLQLPPGTYRMELHLEAGEKIAKSPSTPLKIDIGEIETQVDFTVNNGRL
jgi:hypothetical protein